LKIFEILEKVQRQEFGLPEIQRGYVWRPQQVRDFVESLYKDYPVGMILLWSPPAGFEAEKSLETDVFGKPLYLPKLILDGQQRVTSLSRLASSRFANEQKDILFNVENETFQVESPAIRNEPLWVSVTDVIAQGPIPIWEKIKSDPRLGDRDSKLFSQYLKTLNALAEITKRDMVVQDLVGKSYSDICEIFKIVNSKGTRLRTADLFLAELILRVPKKLTAAFETELKQLDILYGGHNYNAFDTRLLARCLVAVSTGHAIFPERIATGNPQNALGNESNILQNWNFTKDCIEQVVNLVRGQFNLFGLRKLPSANALVPLAALVAAYKVAHSNADEKKMLGWLLLASIWGRYSGSSESEMEKDIQMIRDAGANVVVSEWIRNLKRDRTRLLVEAADLEGKVIGSPFLFGLWVAIFQNRPHDWFSDLRIEGENIGNTYNIDIHHIFPKALMNPYLETRGLGKQEIRRQVNDIANVAFILKGTNIRIGKSEPIDYFKQKGVGETKMIEQFVPVEESLLRKEAFDDFIAERRKKIAEGINKYILAHLGEV
jgi:hypothetical protein